MRVLDLNSINDINNDIIRSSKGRTSGVFLLTTLSSGELKGVLKPVNDNEIIANKLFELLGMPIPKFDVWEKTQISDSITNKIDNSSARASISNTSEKIMVMEAVGGRTLSECNSADVNKFICNKGNQHALGRSMVFDMLIGNADRIFHFSAPIVNPDNIMVKDGLAILTCPPPAVPS